MITPQIGTITSGFISTPSKPIIITELKPTRNNPIYSLLFFLIPASCHVYEQKTIDEITAAIISAINIISFSQIILLLNLECPVDSF